MLIPDAFNILSQANLKIASLGSDIIDQEGTPRQPTTIRQLVRTRQLFNILNKFIFLNTGGTAISYTFGQNDAALNRLLLQLKRAAKLTTFPVLPNPIQTFVSTYQNSGSIIIDINNNLSGINNISIGGSLSVMQNVSISGTLSVTNVTVSGALTLTTPLGPTSGGTGINSYVLGDTLYASAVNVLSKLPIGGSNTFLQVQSGIPGWSTNFTYDSVNNIFTSAKGVTISGAGTRSDNTYLGLNHTDTISASGRNRWNTVVGEQHFIINDAGGTNRNLSDSFILGSFYNKIHLDVTNGIISTCGIVGGLNSMFEMLNNNVSYGGIIAGGVYNIVKPSLSNSTTGVIAGNFAIGGSHNISDGHASGIMGGYWGQSSGAHSLVHGYATTFTGGGWNSIDSSFNPDNSPAHSGSVPRVLASGKHAINISANSTSQTVGFGALADYSGIIGGYDHHIPSTSPQSMIFGGSGIVARASDPNQVYVPNFNIVTAPLNDDALTQVLVRNASTGQIKYRTASTIGAISGLTIGQIQMATSANAIGGSVITQSAGAITISGATTITAATIISSGGLSISSGGVRTDPTGSFYKTSQINIGTWNMQTTNGLAITHGLGSPNWFNIKSIDIVIYNDAGNAIYKLDTFYTPSSNIEGGVVSVDSGSINIYRRATGFFDSASFSGSGNRGYITVMYAV